MKNVLFVAIIMALVSCSKVEMSNDEDNKCIKFCLDGLNIEYGTRATLKSVGCTDVWIFEGEKLLAHKVSTDSDFSSPSVNLTYGSHDITFIASASDGQSVSNGVWDCTKVKDTFSKKLNVTVSGNSSGSRQVELERRSSMFSIYVNDAIPSTVSKMTISIDSNTCIDYDLAGSNPIVYSVSVDMSGKVGMTDYNPYIYILTANATEEEDCNVEIKFLSSSNATLYQYERTVKMKTNRCTNIIGNYFSGSGNELSVNNEWLPQNDVPLFE